MLNRRLSLSMLVTLACATLCWGAAPSLVNYQGEVTDVNGPVAGTFPMEFRIFAASGGGAALWSEALPSVTLSNGLFNVLLGQVTPLPESVFDGNERWLEVVFDGATMSQRVRLVTVPYAHRISTVDGATGGDITTQVRISTTDPGQSLEVYNTAPGTRAARFENTHAANSEATLLGVANGTGPAVSGFSVNGGIGVQSAGDLVIDDFNFVRKFTFDATGTNNGGELGSFMADGTETVELRASEGSGQGAFMRLKQADGNNGLIFDGDHNDYGEIRLYNGATQTMTMSGGEGTEGSRILLDDAVNTNTVIIDGDVGVGARITVLNGDDVSAGGGGLLQLGSLSTNTLGFDQNEIVARNNGAYDVLHLQPNGGAAGVGLSGETIQSSYIFAVDGGTQIFDGTDASTAGASSGYLLLGRSTSANIVMDNNEIIARNNGVAAELHLQAEGGPVMVGALGITAPVGYIFCVDGKAMMEEVEVQLSGDWPDYVFEEDYDLMPLDQLAEHVRAKKHLPGIPSESEMKDARLPLGEMQTKLLEKVEELTLYILQLEERLDASEKDNASLRDRVETIETKSE